MTAKEMKNVRRRVFDGSVDRRRVEAATLKDVVAKAIQVAQEAVLNQAQQFRDELAKWGEPVPEDMVPAVRITMRSSSRAGRALAIVALCFEFLAASYFAYLAFTGAIVFAIFAGLALTSVLVVVAKLFWNDHDDLDRPRGSVEFLRRWARHFAAASVILIVTFLALRMYSIMGELLPWLTALLSGTLAATASAAWIISMIYDRPNEIVKQYRAARNRLDDLEVIKAEIDRLLGSGVDPAIVPLNVGNVGPDSPVQTSPDVNGIHTGGDEIPEKAPKAISTANPSKAGTALTLLVLALLGSASPVYAQPLDGCFFDEVIVAPDTSGSIDAEEYAETIRALATPPRAQSIACAEYWEILPWATTKDTRRRSQVRIYVPPVTASRDAEQLLQKCLNKTEGGPFLKAVKAECEQKIAAEAAERRKVSIATRDSAFADVAGAIAGVPVKEAKAHQTCLTSMLKRAARASRRTLVVITTDGRQEACGPDLSATDSLEPHGARTVVVLLPEGTPSEDGWNESDERAKLLETVYPGIIVVPSFEVRDSWEWLDDVLRAKQPVRASSSTMRTSSSN